MKKYKNLGGNSTVAAFEIAKDYMKVGFTNHNVYRYSNQSVGNDNIRQMKTLALAGKGLGTFIETKVKDKFDRKIR
ncbi:MAG: hypothetical protein FD189_1789 [Elusimicrobia bacterium]|nr:MAG: hypothetical protein FD154_1932 [Elusimicrobiota bacterium]KAF0154605.1 MAG: hypothetical protein FD189_1789 [Elusimicrobiota bacterium]